MLSQPISASMSEALACEWCVGTYLRTLTLPVPMLSLRVPMFPDNLLEVRYILGYICCQSQQWIFLVLKLMQGNQNIILWFSRVMFFLQDESSVGGEPINFIIFDLIINVTLQTWEIILVLVLDVSNVKQVVPQIMVLLLLNSRRKNIIRKDGK